MVEISSCLRAEAKAASSVRLLAKGVVRTGLISLREAPQNVSRYFALSPRPAAQTGSWRSVGRRQRAEVIAGPTPRTGSASRTSTRINALEPRQSLTARSKNNPPWPLDERVGSFHRLSPPHVWSRSSKRTAFRGIVLRLRFPVAGGHQQKPLAVKADSAFRNLAEPRDPGHLASAVLRPSQHAPRRGGHNPPTRVSGNPVIAENLDTPQPRGLLNVHARIAKYSAAIRR